LLTKSLLLCVFSHNQSTISTQYFLHIFASGISSANLSHHFVNIIFPYLPDFLAFSIKKVRLSHTLESLSIDINVSSTLLSDSTTFDLDISS